MCTTKARRDETSDDQRVLLFKEDGQARRQLNWMGEWGGKGRESTDVDVKSENWRAFACYISVLIEN